MGLGHGNSSVSFKRRLFPRGFAGAVMQIVIETWDQFSMNREVRLENRITAVFRQALIEAYVAAGRKWFIALEDPLTDPTFGTEEGRNDLNFFPQKHQGQTIFFTLECKRLHVTRDSGFAHLADEYVVEGMQRFVDGRYCAKLSCGGILGYVMDNDVATAFGRVRQQIATRAIQLRMLRPLRAPSRLLPHSAFSGDTVHQRDNDQFTLHHALVGVKR